MSLDDLFSELLDEDLLKRAAEEEAQLKAAAASASAGQEATPASGEPMQKKMKPASLLFKPSTVTKAARLQSTGEEEAKPIQSVVVSSAAPTINKEYLAQFVPHLAAATVAVPPAPPRPIMHAIAPAPPPAPPRQTPALPSDQASTSAGKEQYRLFVGNLAPEARDDVLIKVFKDYSSVIQVQTVLDKERAKCLGYGFVTFADPFEMLKAMREKNNKLCINRPMQISKAKPENDPSKKFKSGARRM